MLSSFEAQLGSRGKLRRARGNPSHRDHDKPLPNVIPACLVKLWQMCIAQSHRDLYPHMFGHIPSYRLTQTPLAAYADKEGFAVCFERISGVQATLFDQAWFRSIDAFQTSLPKHFWARLGCH